MSSQKTADWLIKGVLPAADIVTIFGASGSGKSFIVLEMAACIALGTPWRGRRVKKGRVVVIAAEGSGSYGKRIKALAQHMGVSERTAKYYLAGELLPRADTIVRFPDLAEELRRDVMPELQAA
jgi:RecA-family ATPase